MSKWATTTPVHPSGTGVPPPADEEAKVTEMAISPNDGAFETTGAAGKATKFEVSQYRHQDLLLRANENIDSEI